MKRYDISKEFLEEEYQRKGRTATDIANELGCSRRTVSNYLTEYGFQSTMGRPQVDRKGQRSGKLVARKCVGTDSRGNARWECRCDCGNTHIIGNNQFGRIQSCGCAKTGVRHKGVPGYFFTRIRDKASVRNLPVKVTIQYIGDLLEEQDYKCALTGWPISISPVSTKRSTASLDRIDSNKPYIQGNLQWVHKDVNRMKWHLKMDRFLEICEAVVQKQSHVS